MMNKLFDFIQGQEITFWLPYAIIGLLFVLNILQIVLLKKKVKLEKRISENSLRQERLLYANILLEHATEHHREIEKIGSLYSGQIKMKNNRIKELQDEHRKLALDKTTIFPGTAKETIEKAELFYQFLNKRTHASRED